MLWCNPPEVSGGLISQEEIQIPEQKYVQGEKIYSLYLCKILRDKLFA